SFARLKRALRRREQKTIFRQQLSRREIQTATGPRDLASRPNLPPGRFVVANRQHDGPGIVGLGIRSSYEPGITAGRVEQRGHHTAVKTGLPVEVAGAYG